MAPRRRPRSGILAGPLVLGGLGLLALVFAAALLWSEGRPAAWAALTIAALFGVRIGREVAAVACGPRVGPGAGSELVTDPSWGTRAGLETTSLHRRRWTRRTLLLVLIAVVLAGLVGIVVDNFELVEVGLLIRRVEIRLGWALAGAGLIGFVVGLVVARLLRRP